MYVTNRDVFTSYRQDVKSFASDVPRRKISTVRSRATAAGAAAKAFTVPKLLDTRLAVLGNQCLARGVVPGDRIIFDVGQ